MSVSAAMVKDLREQTGAGMMDCKKALGETNGDFQAAVDWLRKKGLSAAAKKSGRTAAEGLVGISVHDTRGAVVEVNAETDFVGRNELFQAYVSTVAKLALDSEGNVEKLAGLDYPGTGRTVVDELTNLIATVGENMSLRRAATLAVNQGVVTAYVHNAVSPNLGKIGVLVALESAAPVDKLNELGRQLAMHIAAAAPKSLNVDALDPALIEREKNVLREQAIASGKAPEIVEKMLTGRIRKFYEEVVLLEQTFVVDGETKISAVLEKAGKDLGSPVKIVEFARYQLGEGIEKKESNFAEEVAAAVKG